MDSKDVEEIFKGVLTDESQESQESTFPLTEVGPGTSAPVHASVPHSAAMVSPSGSVTHPGNLLHEQFLYCGSLGHFPSWGSCLHSPQCMYVCSFFQPHSHSCLFIACINNYVKTVFSTKKFS
jgi:hypothetical protein